MKWDFSPPLNSPPKAQNGSFQVMLIPQPARLFVVDSPSDFADWISIRLDRLERAYIFPS